MGPVVTKNHTTKSNIRRQVIIMGDTKVTVGSIMGLSIIFPKDKTCSKTFEFVSLAIDNKHLGNIIVEKATAQPRFLWKYV